MVRPSVIDETATLRAAALFRPGLEAYLGTLDPHASLFTDRFDIFRAREEFDGFRSLLEAHGVTVYDLRGSLATLATYVPTVPSSQAELLDRLQARYPTADPATVARLIAEDACAYGAPAAVALNAATALTVREDGSVGPTANLYFSRDPMNVLVDSVVFSRMRSLVRRPEPALIKAGFRAAGVDLSNAYSVTDPGTFEGGDGIVFGHVAYVGCGSRTNPAGIDQIRSRLPPGYRLMAIVQDETDIDRGRDTMHLDTFCMPVSSSAMVVCEDVAARSRAIDPETGYSRPFLDHLRASHLLIIPCPREEQVANGTNFLVVSPGTIITTNEGHPATDAGLRSQGFDVITAHVEALANGGGGVHCMTGQLVKA